MSTETEKWAEKLIENLKILDDPLFPAGDLLWHHPDPRGRKLHDAMMGLILVARNPKTRAALEELIRVAREN